MSEIKETRTRNLRYKHPALASMDSCKGKIAEAFSDGDCLPRKGQVYCYGTGFPGYRRMVEGLRHPNQAHSVLGAFARAAGGAEKDGPGKGGAELMTYLEYIRALPAEELAKMLRCPNAYIRQRPATACTFPPSRSLCIACIGRFLESEVLDHAKT